MRIHFSSDIGTSLARRGKIFLIKGQAGSKIQGRVNAYKNKIVWKNKVSRQTIICLTKKTTDSPSYNEYSLLFSLLLMRNNMSNFGPNMIL